MYIRPCCWALLAVLCNSAALAAVDVADLVAELQHMRSKARDAVMRFDENALTRYGSGKNRPYSLYVFLTARQVMDNPQLQLETLRSEFGLAAKAVEKGREPDSAFFADVVFEDAPKVFNALQVNQVPYIFRIPGNVKVSLSAQLVIPDKDKMTFQTLGSGNYPWSAEAMLAFFAKQGLVAGPVHRPSIYSHPMFPFAVLAGVAVGALVAWLLLRVGFFHHPLPYAVVAISVFWFSVSGGMYNIIRGMPLFTRDKNGLLRFFLGGRGGQLGAEGFMVGTGYVMFSLAVSLLTYAVPRVKYTAVRSILSYFLVFAATYIVFQIITVFQAKTGHRVSSYLLRS